MNASILNSEVQAFIDKNLNSDITKLLLKGSPFESISTRALAEQIEAKKRCEKKLPTWFNTKDIYYPNKLNIEQTSSEITGRHKANLISGNSLIDITGGFGVDCFYFSKTFKDITHCEQNKELSEIASHNFSQLGAKVKTVAKDGLQFLKEHNETFDWIYVDPSRRHDIKGKVFFLSDCLPNVPEHLDLLFQYSENIVVKSSPLLDISAGIKELKYVSEILIVAVRNEVKELLWLLQKDAQEAIKITCTNLKKEKDENFSFFIDEEKTAQTEFSEPLKHLYEPNAAILKAGAFKGVGKKFGVKKLHPHTHLYTSDELLPFSGRRFIVNKVLPYSKKLFRQENIRTANIATRNFPETVAQIKKKFRLKDGGSTYLFFSTNLREEKIILVCSKA